MLVSVSAAVTAMLSHQAARVTLATGSRYSNGSGNGMAMACVVPPMITLGQNLTLFSGDPPRIFQVSSLCMIPWLFSTFWEVKTGAMWSFEHELA